jgi:hypothetical protein
LLLKDINTATTMATYQIDYLLLTGMIPFASPTSAGVFLTFNHEGGDLTWG